jgi:hypothetical protein
MRPLDWLPALWLAATALTIPCGCGGSAAPPGPAAAPRNLVAQARKALRDDDDHVVALTFLASSVTDAELAALAEHPHLRELTLQECPEITDDGLAALAGAKSLVSLKLLQVPIGDDGLAHLAGATELNDLLLAHSRVRGAGLAHLADLPLEGLTIHSSTASAEELAAIVKLAHLKSLELHCAHLHVEDLPPLAELAQLESLVLTRTPLGPAGLARIAGLPKLKRLLLDAADMSDGQVELLNSLPALEEIDLYNAPVTDAGLAQLELPNLKSLSLADCRQLTDAGLKNLGGLSQLETLNLCGSGVAGLDLTGLAANRALRKVMISGAQFKGNDESLGKLKELLPDCEVMILRG